MERTLVIVKPDGLSRGLLGVIVERLERKGLGLVGCKMSALGEDQLEEHYEHLSQKPFFPRIKRFMQSRPVLIMCWEGRDAVEVVRRVAGSTNGREADPGTLRGDYSMSVQCNLIHASDSREAADREIRRFFDQAELFVRWSGMDAFLYADDER